MGSREIFFKKMQRTRAHDQPPLTVIKASCHEMLRMALNRHEFPRYRRQRKRGLLMQLAVIIAFCASLSPIIQAEEMFRDVCKPRRHSNHASMPVL